MKLHQILSLAVALLCGVSAAHAADLAGRWSAEFDSQIGLQKYIYNFKVDGARITGTAAYEQSMGKGETALKDIKLSGDDVSFVETLSFDGNELTITYTGKIAGDEMKLTRQVGEFATEQIVARRVKATAAKPAAMTAPAPKS